MNKIVFLILLSCLATTAIHSAEKQKEKDFLRKNATRVTKAICDDKKLAVQVINTVDMVEKYKSAESRKQSLINALAVLKTTFKKKDATLDTPYPFTDLQQASNEIATAQFRVTTEIMSDDELSANVLSVVKTHVQKRTERRKSLDDALKTLTDLQKLSLWQTDIPDSGPAEVTTSLSSDIPTKSNPTEQGQKDNDEKKETEPKE
jgi:hypothetical protein